MDEEIAVTRSVEIPEAAVEVMAKTWARAASGEMWDHYMVATRQLLIVNAKPTARASLEAVLPYLAPAVPQPVDREARHYSTEEIAAKIADRVPHADLDGFSLSERLRIGKAVAPLFQELLAGEQEQVESPECTCPTDADVTPDMRTETGQHLSGCPTQGEEVTG